jgi:hypothetical protein
VLLRLRKVIRHFPIDYESRSRIHCENGKDGSAEGIAGVSSQAGEKGRKKGRTRESRSNDTRTAERIGAKGCAGEMG